jgi:hypothetical protein
MRKAAVSTVAFLLVLLGAVGTRAFTTDELVRLKHSGVSEETIVFLVENGCSDVEGIVRLVEAGFKDETIRAIIRAEAKTGRHLPAGGSEVVEHASEPLGPGEGPPGTAVRARIDWYLVYRGEPHRQNFQELDGAKVFLLGGRTVWIEHRTDSGSGMLEFFRKKPFPSPFAWDLERTDSFEAGRGGFACALTSAAARTGRPPVDGSHFWILSLDPKDPEFCESVRKALAGMKGDDGHNDGEPGG